MTDFYKQQSALTAAKIEIYKEYIGLYLPKILMGFGKCFIADLFCGTGKNGKEKGSPLVLLERAQYILTSENLKKKNPQVYILFNDKDSKNITNLKQELEGFIDESINIFPSQNKDFVVILPELLKKLKNSSIPKFFFLDPFTYSNVNMGHLRSIMNLEHAEVLLFIPIFHSYRFASDKRMKKDHETRKFVEAFTKKGVADYKDSEDGKGDKDGVYEFMQSMKEKLREDLGLDFVRPVLLDAGNCKNALFLLTKSQEGMLCMNKVALKKSESGQGVNVKSGHQSTLWGTQGTSKFELFSKKLVNELKRREEMTNKHLVKFGIMEEFLPKHVKDVLENLYKENKIKVFDAFGDEVVSKRNWNIAEKISKTIIFRFNNQNL